MRSFYINHKNVNLFCREFGTGETILMIHGACVDSDYFTDVARALAHDFHVVTYDRRGYGRSREQLDSDHSVSIQAEDAAIIIRRQGCACHIIAHSVGTSVAMELVQKYPELIRTVLLYEPFRAEECDDERTTELLQISRWIHDGNVVKAMRAFLPMLGAKDSRARCASDEETRHMQENFLCFLKKEFDTTMFFKPNINRLRSIRLYVGVGECSRDLPNWFQAHRLAEQVSAPVVYFPGGHSCAFALPMEFAWLAEGIMRRDSREPLNNM